MSVDPQQEIQRLDFNSLVQHGRQALRERRYGPATRLLREAARRAPFRADLRELLGEAMQGASSAERHAATATAPPPRRPAPSPEHTDRDFVDFEPEATSPPPMPQPAARPRPAQAEPRPSLLASASASSAARVFNGVSSRPVRMAATTQRQPRPALGRERAVEPRSKSPLGPLLIGMAVAVIFIGCAVGGWLFLVRHREAERVRMERERLAVIVAKANEYKARGEYALALEQLNALPANAQRSEQLATLYRDKGMANLQHQPPDYANAIQDFSAGLKAQPTDTALGVCLGQAYYQLAADQRDSDRTASENNLKQARTTFEIVLDSEPNNLNALNYLAKIATLQRDPVLQQQSYKNIMKAAPGTREAADAERNLRSLGMRP